MIKVLILAGGLGTRLREETEFRPKPMVEIGGRPILWHIMKNLSQQGVSEFCIATGYKGELIKDYFLNYHALNNDITVSLGTHSTFLPHGEHDESRWKVTITDTGDKTMTGGRVFKARKYLSGERFMCTYGDGLANVNLQELIAFHEQHGRIATVTTVQPISRFGMLEVNSDNLVTAFHEKPKMTEWVNAGFFIFENSIFDFLGEDSTLEVETLIRLASDKQLFAYKHKDFFQPMDTIREVALLNDMWSQKNTPWKNW